MKTIEYKITLADGGYYFVTVEARNINSGLRKALRHALAYDERELSRIEFWMVMD